MNTNIDPKVYIVILNWNGWRDTVECLNSLEDLDYSNYEIVVVDNASTDDSVKKIRERYPQLTILESDFNRGFSGGNNIGIRHALKQEADYVWLLNNDTVVDRKALTALVERMEEDPEIGICGSKLIYYHKPDTIQALAGGRYNRWLGISRHIGEGGDANHDFNVQEIENKLAYIVGASMLVSNEFVKEVGLLCEDYFLYYEEIDWAVRAKNRYRLGFAKESVVFHKVGASIQKDNPNKSIKSRLADYYQIKNRLKFTWNHYPGLILTVYISVLGAIFNRMLRGQWDRIPMVLKLLFTFNSHRNE